MGLFSRFSNKVDLKRLLKDAPITYKLNDKGNEIRLFGQSFYRIDPTEIMLNPEHTSVILYSHNGKNLYGIYGDGLLETDTWKEWTNKQFDNKDINGAHVSPFYKARFVLRLPKDTSVDLFGFNYETVGDDLIATEYRGSKYNLLYIPHGATIVSIEATQLQEKEYFGPIIVEPTAETVCTTGISDKIFKTVIVLTAIIALMLLLYACLCRKEGSIVEPSESATQNDQLSV